MRPHALLVVGVGLLLAADDTKQDAVKKEIANIQGTWRFVSMEVEGMKHPDKHVSSYTLVLKGDQWAFSDGKKSAAKLTFQLDPAKTPKTIDLVDMDVEKKRIIRGLYSSEGDTLTVCYHRDPGKEGDRPTEFATKPDSGLVLFVLKREKPTKSDQETIQGSWKVVDAMVLGKKVEGTGLGEKGILHLATLNLLFIFEGDKWEGRALDKVESRGTFKLDSGKKPKTIDLRIADGDGTHLGIYRLEGNKLTLCLPDRSKEGRPSEFSSTMENKCSLIMLERKK